MEEWKDIPGFEGYYQASNLGRIKRLERSIRWGKNNCIRVFPEIIMVPCYLPKGYTYVGFNILTFKKSFRIHRLVAQTFIPNPENKPEVNHKNGIKDDNRVVNLEWATSSENAKHSYDVLGRIHVSKIDKDVIQVSLDGFIQNVFKSRTEAAKLFNVRVSAITNAINRQSLFLKNYRLY